MSRQQHYPATADYTYDAWRLGLITQGDATHRWSNSIRGRFIAWIKTRILADGGTQRFAT